MEYGRNLLDASIFYTKIKARRADIIGLCKNYWIAIRQLNILFETYIRKSRLIYYEKVVISYKGIKMKNLTITEQIYLISIWHLKEEAYGVKIREKIIELTGKSMVFGTLYNNLDYLVKKGFVISEKGETGPNRGGNIKVFYKITERGLRALQEARELQESLWAPIPKDGIIG